VHADLSEYNLLWYNNFIYVIDVSQAVELDHPMALDFLRRDCSIMNDFFSKKNLRVLTTQETYEFVTDFGIRDEENHLASIFENVVNLRDNEPDKLAQVDDEVFKQMYIPRNIHELSIEDIYRMQK
jgi:RIO kinase 1